MGDIQKNSAKNAMGLIIPISNPHIYKTWETYTQLGATICKKRMAQMYQLWEQLLCGSSWHRETAVRARIARGQILAENTLPDACSWHSYRETGS